MAKESSSGVSIVGLLGVVFVTLKLLGILKWSWWWVTFPFWGPAAFLFGIAAIFLLVGAVIKALD